MKNKTAFLLRLLAVSGMSMIALPATASELGEQYFGIVASSVDIDVDGAPSPWEFAGELNIPLLEVEEGATGFGVDATAGLSYFSVNSETEGVGFLGGARGYYRFNDWMAPFVGAGIGYTVFDGSDGSVSWFVNFGVEFAIGERFSIAPSIENYSSGAEAGEFSLYGADDVTVYALDANFWITDMIGLNAFVQYMDENEVETTVFGGSVRFRY